MNIVQNLRASIRYWSDLHKGKNNKICLNLMIESKFLYQGNSSLKETMKHLYFKTEAKPSQVSQPDFKSWYLTKIKILN